MQAPWSWTSSLRAVSIKCLLFKPPHLKWQVAIFYSSHNRLKHILMQITLGLHLWHMEIPRPNQSCSCWTTPQPQQLGILNPLSKARIEPASSCMLVGFITTEPQRELPQITFLYSAYTSTPIYNCFIQLSLPPPLSFLCRTRGVWKILGQGSKPCHSSDTQAWEPPYAMGAAQEMAKKNGKIKRTPGRQW